MCRGVGRRGIASSAYRLSFATSFSALFFVRERNNIPPYGYYYLGFLVSIRWSRITTVSHAKHTRFEEERFDWIFRLFRLCHPLRCKREKNYSNRKDLSG